MDLTSIIFGIILLVVFIWGFRNKRIQEITPTILTMIGIFGTFLGIIIGLLQFDVRAIDASIPHLLDGLKVAFIVSATGVFLAILFKIINELSKSKEIPTLVESEITPKAIYDVIAEGNKQQKQLFNELKCSISGEDDGSLVNQLIRLRSDVKDSAEDSQEITRRGFEAMQGKFQEFADKVVETGSQSLIETLESTIKDFNMKLSEQLGENFKQLYDVISEGNKQQKQLFNELKRSITGEDDNPLVNQLIRLLSDVKDSAENSQEITRRGFEAMQGKFQEFADKIVEIGSKSLIEALESTIKDFNMKLSEQFGENFKQLNEAVKELVVWQENYRVQMEEMRNDLQKTQSAFEFALQGIEKSETSLKEIAESTSFIAKQTEIIPQTLNGLSHLMQGLDIQSQTLATHLNSFKELGEKATSALPRVQQMMDDLMNGTKNAQMMITSQLSVLKLGFDDLKSAANMVAVETKTSLQQMTQQNKQVTDVMNGVEQNFAKFKDALESQRKIADALSEHFKQLTEVTKEFDGALKSQKSTFGELKRGFDELKGQLDERVNKLRTEFDHANKNLQQVIDNQFKSLDEQMTKEMQRTIDQFGKHLISLSTGFVDNYEKLTKQLSKAVEDLRKEVHSGESRK